MLLSMIPKANTALPTYSSPRSVCGSWIWSDILLLNNKVSLLLICVLPFGKNLDASCKALLCTPCIRLFASAENKFLRLSFNSLVMNWILWALFSVRLVLVRLLLNTKLTSSTASLLSIFLIISWWFSCDVLTTFWILLFLFRVLLCNLS